MPRPAVTIAARAARAAGNVILRYMNRIDGLHVVERFSCVDRDTLRYQFTVEDPEFTKPWSGEFPWEQTTDRLYEYACHEGNYAMGNILRGARLMEKEALAKRAAAPSGR